MSLFLKTVPELSPNQLALPIVQDLLARSKQFQVEVHLIGGAKVIDCGIAVPGGWDAGLSFASICLGGLARVTMHWADFGGLRWPAVEVVTDHPILACLASQYAGWLIKKDKFSAMGSGPGRAVVQTEELFVKLGYTDPSPVAIFCLESRQLPTEDVVKMIVEKCGREPSDVYFLVAPTASQVGSLQIAARAVETGLQKLMELGYDLSKVESGWGICPLPPVAANDLSALGRTNDAVLYGASVQYQLSDDDETLAALVGKIPSLASRDYGELFEKLFQRYGNFYDIDPLIFSPAEVWLSNRRSGRSFHAGALRQDLLSTSFGLSL
jgi:methenyltetrahydromethanopterin cyclohydrolase